MRQRLIKNMLSGLREGISKAADQIVVANDNTKQIEAYSNRQKFLRLMPVLKRHVLVKQDAVLVLLLKKYKNLHKAWRQPVLILRRLLVRLQRLLIV